MFCRLDTCGKWASLRNGYNYIPYLAHYRQALAFSRTRCPNLLGLPSWSAFPLDAGVNPAMAGKGSGLPFCICNQQQLLTWVLLIHRGVLHLRIKITHFYNLAPYHFGICVSNTFRRLYLTMFIGSSHISTISARPCSRTGWCSGI